VIPRAAALLAAASAEAEAQGMVRVSRLARAAVAVTGPAATDVDLLGQATFRREGDVWLLRFGGSEARVRSTKGMADLAVLLARPGTEVHVAELVGASGALGTTGSSDAVLDTTAITAYRRRLHELTDEEDDADLAGDAARSTRAREEREAIVDHLATGLGLGGVPRSTPDWVERARKAVRRRIDAALQRIEAEHPTAGRHLRRSVNTGAFCSYDPAEPVRWET